jgi:hypothetical protein
LYDASSESVKRSIDLLQAKGTSAWLTTRPSKEHDFYLNRDEFRDAMCLRYGWSMNLPQTCECGTQNDIDHALTCKTGGFVILRHNTVRDIEADMMRTVCKDVVVEPPLIAVTQEERSGIVGNLQENARLDVSCRSFWSPLQRAFFDVRITHPNAASNRGRSLDTLLLDNEKQKKQAYNDRVLHVEHASFTPLVFATNGAMGKEAQHFHAVLAEKMSIKTGNSYAETMQYIRRRVTFAILKTALISLRGQRKKRNYTPAPIQEIDINLAVNTW